MAEQDAVMVESVAPPEVQAEAEKMGWIPPARFKGDAERFVDAEEYIKRGETVLPIVKEQNKRLHADVARLSAENAATAAALTAAQKAIEEIEERHSVATQKAVEKARQDLKGQLAQASEAGDHEAVAEITDQMTRLTDAEKTASEKADDKKVVPPAFVPSADQRRWESENPWFGADKRKTALALAVAQELREAGETAINYDFFEKVRGEVEKTFQPREEPRTDKVEGGRNGSDSDSRQTGKRSYIHLPAEAKQACDADQKRFVGEGKRYKTLAEWRSRYAEMYFE